MKCVERHARRKATARHKPTLISRPNFIDTRKVGRPRLSNVFSDEVTLTWEPPILELGNDGYYQISFKEIDHDKRWRYFPGEFKKSSVVLNGLKSNTSYVFRVRAVYEEGEGTYSSDSATVTTCQSRAFRIANIIGNSANVDQSPHILPVPITKITRQDIKNIREFHIGEWNARHIGENKTIMLLGATGSGKSTLVDGFINYVFGVNWNDPFRFTVKDASKVNGNMNKAISQEDWITIYTLHPETGSRLHYQLEIIDTPGFGDTRGVGKDQDMIEQIQMLFSENITNCLTNIDAICFVLKAPDARLTLHQKYIFQSVLSIFGNDVKNNICSLITFADGKDPPVIAGMKESRLPFGCTFSFNNCSLYVKNKGIYASSLASMFWEISVKGFRSFFAHLDSSSSCNLDRTREVLHVRLKADAIAKQLQPKIDDGRSKTGQLLEEQKEITKIKTVAQSYKSLEMYENEVQQRKRDLPRGQNVTNCLNCNVSCHVNCNCSPEDKSKCRVMNYNGYCTICPNKCHWQQHANTPYIFELVQVKVKKILHEKQQKYLEQLQILIAKEKIVEKLTEDIRKIFNEANALKGELQKCTKTLSEIGLQENPFIVIKDHIDVLLQNEKLERKEGFLKRMSILKEIQKRAELLKYFNRFREDVNKLF
ncbi:uncharacterized protein LOC132717902 [Ruditapes philippinarum]|uniref:uncharacterized protein LOC132717902 n=1 Tax=Ruditapes philippinarum TaxID=129788 RepID=UPI00295B2C7F|nr:uncharacterized protein LOC132717902 [Ruditapes philippinarum]